MEPSRIGTTNLPQTPGSTLLHIKADWLVQVRMENCTMGLGQVASSFSRAREMLELWGTLQVCDSKSFLRTSAAWAPSSKVALRTKTSGMHASQWGHRSCQNIIELQSYGSSYCSWLNSGMNAPTRTDEEPLKQKKTSSKQTNPDNDDVLLDLAR